MLDKSADQPQVPAADSAGVGAVGGASDGAVDATDVLLEAALDRSWDKLSLFSGSPGDPFADVADEPVVSAKKGVVADKAEKKAEAPAEAQEKPDALKTSGVPYEAPESADVVVAIAEASKNMSKKELAAAARAAKAKVKADAKSSKAAAKAQVKAAKAATLAEGAKEQADAARWDRAPRWYFLQVKPGCEQSCAISLRNLARSMPHLSIREVMVPAMQILRLTKGGKAVKKEERIYPSYILIHMSLDYDSYSHVQSVPNVQFFMGDPNRDKKRDQPFMPPLPVSGEELRSVFERMRTAEQARPESKTVLRPGDSVEVLEGEHLGKIAIITAVRPDLNSVTVALRSFARLVHVDHTISDVKKVEPVPKEELEEAEVEEDESVARNNDDDDEFVSPEVVDSQAGVKADGYNVQAGGAKFATVLDAIDGPPGPIASDDFADLLDNDLPDFPMRFEQPSSMKREKKRKANQDPMQDLADLFDENGSEKVVEFDSELHGEGKNKSS